MKLARKLGMALRSTQRSTLFAIIILSLIFSSVTPPQTVQAVAANPAAHSTEVRSATINFLSPAMLAGYWNSFTAEVGKIFSNISVTMHQTNAFSESAQSQSDINVPNTVQGQDGLWVSSGLIPLNGDAVEILGLTSGKAYTIMTWGAYISCSLDLYGCILKDTTDLVFWRLNMRIMGIQNISL
jgi:hypothetical protein